jgi:hypothetical protein
MNQATVFGLGTMGALLAALAVVATMGRPLKAMLVELCGTEERAGFWLVFSNVMLLLTPVIFAMHMRPDAEEPRTLAHQLSLQMESGLIGLVLAVLVLGFVMGSFIPRGATSATEPGRTAAAR